MPHWPRLARHSGVLDELRLLPPSIVRRFPQCRCGENIAFLNDSALVDTDFGKAASVLGRHIDAFYLYATIGARQARWYAGCLLLNPIGIAASGNGYQDDCYEYPANAHVIIR